MLFFGHPLKVLMRRLLFLCSRNKLRSPTAEVVFSDYEEFEVDSAGLSHDAEIQVSSEMIAWADIIFVMEKSHRKKLSDKFRSLLNDKRIICLDIPDHFEFMEPALIKLLKRKVLPLLRAYK
jgi:predicted protein tyrosine phosphatase